MHANEQMNKRFVFDTKHLLYMWHVYYNQYYRSSINSWDESIACNKSLQCNLVKVDKTGQTMIQVTGMIALPKDACESQWHFFCNSLGWGQCIKSSCLYPISSKKCTWDLSRNRDTAMECTGASPHLCQDIYKLCIYLDRGRWLFILAVHKRILQLYLDNQKIWCKLRSSRIWDHRFQSCSKNDTNCSCNHCRWRQSQACSVQESVLDTHSRTTGPSTKVSELSVRTPARRLSSLQIWSYKSVPFPAYYHHQFASITIFQIVLLHIQEWVVIEITEKLDVWLDSPVTCRRGQWQHINIGGVVTKAYYQ